MGLQPRKTAHLEEDEPVLPLSTSDDPSSKSRRSKSPAALKIVVGHPIALLALLATLLYFTIPAPTAPVSVFGFEFPFPKPSPAPHPPHVVEGLAKCKVIAKSPPTFNSLQSLKRSHNDRYAPGTQDTLLKNATIWTGNKDGEEVIHGGDVLLVNGLVKKIGKGLQVEQLKREGLVKSHVEEVELDGAWLTPGIVDMHSHLAVDAAPSLRGSADTNSILGPVLPWLRSLDGFDTHDQAFNLSISGGITTMLVLPGSADNIGGQAFTFKPRWTKENTPESMLVEPPFVTKNGTWERTGAWRHIKHACGENPSRVYGQTRMDSAYNFRAAYDNGKRLKDAQERWCASPTTQTEPFPDSLEWEVLADVIRGNVKVNIHCYETVDLNDLVRISNEYKFHIAAFHHAHETYLVPDLLKRTYGGNPFVAIFATNARYKKEAWRGSEFAPKILTDAGLDVTMKSDHPVLDSRYLMFEAAQAHHYGLNFSKALSSVTVNSARAVGLDHRLGYVREGYDADLVVWDSFPLNLGATPKQTYIDGIPQLLNPFAVSKPASAQEISKEGVWTEEIQEALDTRGDPDLRPKKSNGNIIFQNVQESFLPDNQIIASSSLVSGRQANTTVVVVEGKIACVGECVEVRKAGLDFDVIDLKGGSIAPGLISVGSGLGLKEIDQEKSTQDGAAYNALAFNPELIDGLVVHAVDGVSFGGKNTLLSYRGGVTQGVTPPQSSSFFQGLSFAFSTSAEHPLSDNAILNPSAALHLQLDNSQYSVSTKLAVLRRLLQNGTGEDTELTRLVNEVKHGAKTLVVHVNKADYIATLVRLKRDVAPGMKLTILGGAESWIVADELAKEDVGVIVSPARSFPGTWDQRRILPGPPLSQHTLPSYLAERGVKVGLGIVEEWQARNTRYEAAWTYTSSGSTFTKQTALDLVSKNLEELLGLSDRKAGVTLGEEGASWVAYEGDLFSMKGRVRAVKAHGSATIDLF